MIGTVIPYKFYFFGSEDSTDVDVLIEHPIINTNVIETELNDCIKKLKVEFPHTKNWDINLVKIENEVVVKSIPSKGTVEGVNNSLFSTFNLHQQKFECPIDRLLEKNIELETRRYTDFVLTIVKKGNHKAFYKKELRPALKFRNTNTADHKVEIMKAHQSFADYLRSEKCLDADELKKLSFYAIQLNAFLKENKEIYTKSDAKQYRPKLVDLLNRKNNNDALEDLCLLLEQNINLL